MFEIFNMLIYSISMICCNTFTFMKHPLAMGLVLLSQTFFICLMSGFTAKSFWFSYVLFLIFLGGMLVLFIYVTALASNEMFNFSMKIFLFCLIFFITMFLIILMLDKNLLYVYFMNHENEKISNMMNLMMENSFIMNKLYSFPINFITIMLMIYLFLTLIAVVKITNIFEGPLRPNF